MNARETAERHAQDVVDGNLPCLMGDFAGSALNDLMASGAMPPNPTTKWTILSETRERDSVRFHVLYANDTEQLELETTWKRVDTGDWKILNAERASA